MDEQIEKFLQNVSEEDRPTLRLFLENLTGLTNGTSDTCPQCNQPIDEMKQVGRSVYGYPCGHRLYQGRIPPNWQNKGQ